MLLLFGMAFQIYKFIIMEGYLNLDLRWPLPTYLGLSIFAALTLLIIQIRLLIFFIPKSFEYLSDSIEYRDDWPGIKFGSTLKCTYQQVCTITSSILVVLYVGYSGTLFYFIYNALHEGESEDEEEPQMEDINWKDVH